MFVMTIVISMHRTYCNLILLLFVNVAKEEYVVKCIICHYNSNLF